MLIGVFIRKVVSMSKIKLSNEERKRFELLGFYLRELRYGAGLTQEKVSQQTNIARSTIIDIEGGKTNYGIQNLLVLSDCYNIPVSQIMEIMN